MHDSVQSRAELTSYREHQERIHVMLKMKFTEFPVVLVSILIVIGSLAFATELWLISIVVDMAAAFIGLYFLTKKYRNTRR